MSKLQIFHEWVNYNRRTPGADLLQERARDRDTTKGNCTIKRGRGQERDKGIRMASVYGDSLEIWKVGPQSINKIPGSPSQGNFPTCNIRLVQGLSSVENYFEISSGAKFIKIIFFQIRCTIFLELARSLMDHGSKYMAVPCHAVPLCGPNVQTSQVTCMRFRRGANCSIKCARAASTRIPIFAKLQIYF